MSDSLKGTERTSALRGTPDKQKLLDSVQRKSRAAMLLVLAAIAPGAAAHAGEAKPGLPEKPDKSSLTAQAPTDSGHESALRQINEMFSALGKSGSYSGNDLETMLGGTTIDRIQQGRNPDGSFSNEDTRAIRDAVILGAGTMLTLDAMGLRVLSNETQQRSTSIFPVWDSQNIGLGVGITRPVGRSTVDVSLLAGRNDSSGRGVSVMGSVKW